MFVIPVRLPELGFQPGPRIKYLKNKARDYMKKVSARAERS